jgi:hypothetical protein
MKLLKELAAFIEARIATFDHFICVLTFHREDVGHRYTFHVVIASIASVLSLASLSGGPTSVTGDDV